MSRKNSNKRAFKYVLTALACTAAFSMAATATACQPEEEDKTEDTKTVTKEDNQLLKNGNFEFFAVPEKAEDGNEPVYLINTPDNWTHGGTSSYTMSGIIDTNTSAWKKLTASDLAEKLDVNNALDTSAEDYKDKYVDYNGMKSSDLLYRDAHGALNLKNITSKAETVDGKEVTRYYLGDSSDTEIYFDEDADKYYYDEAHTRPVSDEQIANPGTHYTVKTADDGSYYIEDEKFVTDENPDGKKTVYKNSDGDYFLDSEFKETFTNVLMLHNYATSHNGITQNYSSLNVTLPANTAAEISVWVKTADLLFHQGEDVTQDRGAYIAVSNSVGNTTLDEFRISCIDTETLLGDTDEGNNGWIKYTVFVEACNFASSTVSLTLGLGETGKTVEGYAFFDDVTVTQYKSIDDCEAYNDSRAEIEKSYTCGKNFTRNAACSLLSDATEKIFEVSKYAFNSGVGEDVFERFSDCRSFLMNLTSDDEYSAINVNPKAGLTVDDDNYVTSTWDSGLGFHCEGVYKQSDNLLYTANAKLPDALKNLLVGTAEAGIDTREDLIASYKAKDLHGNTITSGNPHFGDIKDELKTAYTLPNSGADNTVLLMFSAHGATYNTTFDLSVSGQEYRIISFWVKTSDMSGGTAATVKLTQLDENDKKTDNVASVSVDSTDVVTDLNDEYKDIYNGWVQCFFFVHNELDTPVKLTLDFNFGVSTIKDTAISSYKAGWAALANMQSLDNLDEDTFGYTGSGSYTSSLTVSKEEEKKNSAFDSVYGNQENAIKTDIVNPASYKGVNGSGSYVLNNEDYTLPFDETNTNGFAGLINKDYVGAYADKEWFNTLYQGFGYSATEAAANWDKVFSSTSVQPLIIVNKLRAYEQNATANENTYKNYYVLDDNGDITVDGKKYRKVGENDKYDEDTDYFAIALNYGFVGETQSLSADAVNSVSVRVKVSKGAVAYIYLVDADKEVLEFTAPTYSFYYDEDGNVLKGEPEDDATVQQLRENILYFLRDDGLYEDKDGNLYANTWNYTKTYTETALDKSATYYDVNGNEVQYNDLVDGETYYVSKDNKDVEVNHFLTTGDGTKIYEYKNGKYYYIVNYKTQDKVVTPFDTSYARYGTDGFSEDYFVVIDGNDDSVAGKWITVTFVIQTGSDTKNYRLELWSGSRENAIDSNLKEGSSVIFDFSHVNESDDTVRAAHESDIIKQYQKLLNEKGLLKDEVISSSTENISYYEELVKSYIGKGIDQAEYDAIKNGYEAHYYTYSLYDSADYKPFNADVADENTTGYDYDVSEYNEELAYLLVRDDDSYTVYTNYSVVDKSISLNTVTDDEDEDEDEEQTDNTNVWLLASSIVLVVALIFAMLAILLKDAIKKARRNKVLGKNNYNHKKTNRYMRKLHIVKDETADEDSSDVENDEADKSDETPDGDGQE